MTVDKVFLVGFMAAGKTTVARALAARLGWQAEDVDELIEARERRTVAEIFARQGEPYFRAIEREILQLLLPLRHLVVATGGGTFVDPDNRTRVGLVMDVPDMDAVMAAMETQAAADAMEHDGVLPRNARDSRRVLTPPAH